MNGAQADGMKTMCEAGATVAGGCLAWLVTSTAPPPASSAAATTVNSQRGTRFSNGTARQPGERSRISGRGSPAPGHGPGVTNSRYRPDGGNPSVRSGSPACCPGSAQACLAVAAQAQPESGRVMQDQAEGVPDPRADRADAVPHRRGRPAPGRAHRPVPGGEDQPMPPLQQAGRSPRLRPWPLLDKQELPACMVRPRRVQADHDLQWEDEITVQVAMQGVPVSGLVAQQDRRRPLLPGRVAHIQPFAQGVRPRPRPAELGRPVPGDRQQPAVERRAQLGDQFGQRVPEVPVLAGPEPVPRYVDGGPEHVFPVVQLRDALALGRAEQLRRLGAAVGVQFPGQRRPVETVQPSHTAAPSRVSSTRLTSGPPTYLPRVPSLLITRWQGTTTGSGLVEQAVAAARTAFGWPAAAATPE